MIKLLHVILYFSRVISSAWKAFLPSPVHPAPIQPSRPS